jgi:hypothetical protein
VSSNPKVTVKQGLIAAVLIAAGAVIAHYHVASQSYFPVVRMSAPEGVTYLAVQPATHERQDCGAANDRFLLPIKEGCKECRLEYARCERELAGVEASLLNGSRVPHYQVFGPGLRMAVMGPAQNAKAACTYIAADMVKRGLASAVCVEPDRLPPISP